MDIDTSQISEAIPSKKVVDACVEYAAGYHKLPPLIIKTIISVEGGKIGTMSKNTNGTYDMGIMQINTIHIPDFQTRFPAMGLNWKKISGSACINIFLGSSILKDRLSEADSFWIGVGNYHSKTPKYRTRYLKKIYAAYKRLLASGE